IGTSSSRVQRESADGYGRHQRRSAGASGNLSLHRLERFVFRRSARARQRWREVLYRDARRDLPMGVGDARASTPTKLAAPSSRAVVVGTGPNGLAAAIVLAQAGMRVEVFEAEAQPGGGARTMELTLPGFRHDFGSAVHPMAVGSPFFSSLPLREYGLEWIHSPSVVAHPFDDGTAALLERNLSDAVREFGEDGQVWEKLMGPLAGCWSEVAPDLLSPLL